MNPVANSISTQQTLAGMAPEQIEDEQPQPNDFLYQAVTVLAILVLLLNF